MIPYLTADNLSGFAYTNLDICARPIRGAAVEFMGLGSREMFSQHTRRGRVMAEAGVLYIIPYLNPWAWMNRQAVETTDAILDTLYTQLALPDDLPLVSTGGSMGGQSALVYMVYAGRTPAACVANCPVCDLPYHLTERPDLPRTLLSAFGDTDARTLPEALEAASPLHLVPRMPRADYTVYHCGADLAVNQQMHSDRFVQALSRRFPVTYVTVPDRGHCDLPPEVLTRFDEAILTGAGARP